MRLTSLSPSPACGGGSRGERVPKIFRVSEIYHFVTDWRFRAPLQKVWSVVLDIERYPGWWKNFRRVKITRGDGKSVGSVIACEVRGSLPYSLKYAHPVAIDRRPSGHRALGILGSRAVGRQGRLLLGRRHDEPDPELHCPVGERRARPQPRTGDGQRLCRATTLYRGVRQLRRGLRSTQLRQR
ncbi:MAG: hypothetical protein E6I25_06615 [Chloroflexi bacterium]|nr:MAG: hypothetical protein E6I25_06615 [Chloroflexota bacterium]